MIRETRNGWLLQRRPIPGLQHNRRVPGRSHFSHPFPSADGFSACRTFSPHILLIPLQIAGLGLECLHCCELFGGCSFCVPIPGAFHLAIRCFPAPAENLCSCARDQLPRSLGEGYFVFLTCKHQEKSARTAPCMGSP